MINDLNTQTRKIVAEQLGSLMLSNIELATQLQSTMAELGKLKSEAAAKPARKPKAAAPKLNGKADVGARA